MSKRDHRRGGGRRPIPNLPRGKLPVPGLDVPADQGSVRGGAQVIPAQLVQEFLTKLPSRSLVPWYRTLTIDGDLIDSASNAAPNVQRQIDDAQTRITRLIMYMAQYWYIRGNDPVDGDVLERYQGDQGINGRLSFNLLLNNTNPLNVSASTFDPGFAVPRVVTGFLALNVNLLEMGGAQPSVIYVSENQRIDAQWHFNPLTTSGNTITHPAIDPAAVGVELRGFTTPTAEFERVMNAIRR